MKAHAQAQEEEARQQVRCSFLLASLSQSAFVFTQQGLIHHAQQCLDVEDEVVLEKGSYSVLKGGAGLFIQVQKGANVGDKVVQREVTCEWRCGEKKEDKNKQQKEVPMIIVKWLLHFLFFCSFQRLNETKIKLTKRCETTRKKYLKTLSGIFGTIRAGINMLLLLESLKS
jgi:hypothetical protein